MSIILRNKNGMPLPPLSKIVKEGDLGPYCAICDSSLKKNYWFFRTSNCINPQCPNYWKNKE